MKTHNTKKGFTLIELLVVLAVIGVLSGIVLQSLGSARLKSRNTQRIANIDQIAKAFQVSTTGTTNQSPSSSPGASWKCLGRATCWNSTLVWSPALNSIVNSGITGGAVPTDPFFISTQWGDAYTYNSDSTPIPTSGPLLGIPQQQGAYLAWVMEDQGGSLSCGRGFVYSTSVSGSTGYECMLIIGTSTLNP